MELLRHSASGDKMDEVHEQLQEMMGNEFPDYPRGFETALQYYEWLNAQLTSWTDEGGGYEVVEIDDRCSDEQHLFVVYRKDTARILEIAGVLGLMAQRPIDYFRRLNAR